MSSGERHSGGRNGLRRKILGREINSLSLPIREHFLYNSQVFNSPTDIILEGEMRTDPGSSVGGDTDLHRMQLRLWHHISTLKIVHCRDPFIIFYHYTRVKEREQTTKRWKQSVRIPRVLVRSSIWVWTDEDLHPVWAPGAGRNQPVEPGVTCTRFTTLISARSDF